MKSVIFLICSIVLFTHRRSGVHAQSGVGNLRHIFTKTNPNLQETSGQEVIKRLFPKRHSEFTLKVDPGLTDTPNKDAFELNWEDGKVTVTGTTAVAALYGFNFYLKYYCKCHIAWEGRQLNLPEILPQVSLRLDIQDRFRYYQNACTDSYSFVWWDWPKWEEHIDWMALNGINLPLAFTGQEALWLKVYSELGLDINDLLQNYIAGPAFLAWWRMGNIQKWGGPLPEAFLVKKLELLKKIVVRMRSLGMTPVLPAFSGNIPKSLITIFPNASVAHHSSWNKFNESYSSTYMLLPTDPLFIEIGKRFIKELNDTIGTDHIYSCDTFNENRPVSNDSTFLHQMAQSTYLSMAAADPNSVWMIQSWVFTDTKFWQREQVESYLSGVSKGNALILDLEAELFPLYKPYDSFFNHSFIWCMLHNFGGNHGLYGAIGLVNQGVPNARQGNNSLVGTGMCPEGINQNYFIYDFMSEASLRENPINVTKWALEYQERRYGVLDSNLSTAWKYLIKRIYNAPPLMRFHGRTVITRRPSLTLKELLWYDTEDIYNVVNNFVIFGNNTTPSNDSLIRYDTVDFSRQFLQVLFSRLYKTFLGYYFVSDLKNAQLTSDKLLEILVDMDSVLSTDKNFLLGKWISDAEAWGTTSEEKRLLRYNALNQITLWGPNGEIVDYAAKQWSGLIRDFSLPRWTLLIRMLAERFGVTFDYHDYKRQVLENVEIPFTLTSFNYPTTPSGDACVKAAEILQKWGKPFKNYMWARRNQTKKFRRPKPNKNIPHQMLEQQSRSSSVTSGNLLTISKELSVCRCSCNLQGGHTMVFPRNVDNSITTRLAYSVHAVRLGPIMPTS
ncbi:unnamed protein product [Allacma fusca]|uniref:Alpha-N-acetylglucosaminidase n=1 Tax=Allacma fusca TaxID=39272 RepID=A0A8J2PC78_9HEXA|nr:unnamed protein product [Allacma fusca]